MTKQHNTKEIIQEDIKDLLQERVQGDYCINGWSYSLWWTNSLQTAVSH